MWKLETCMLCWIALWEWRKLENWCLSSDRVYTKISPKSRCMKKLIFWLNLVFPLHWLIRSCNLSFGYTKRFFRAQVQVKGYKGYKNITTKGAVKELNEMAEFGNFWVTKPPSQDFNFEWSQRVCHCTETINVASVKIATEKLQSFFLEVMRNHSKYTTHQMCPKNEPYTFIVVCFSIKRFNKTF